MKNRVLIFGGSLFTGVRYHNGAYEAMQNKIVQKMNVKYLIDNFSNAKLTSSRALSFLKECIKERSYTSCVLALGEADFESIHVNDFIQNVEEMISILKDHQIQPLLISLPKKVQKQKYAIEYQNAIDIIAQKQKIEYVYNGEMNSIADHKVKNESQMKRTLIDLCS